MEGYFTWICGALAGLLLVAVAVAWFEHLVREDGRQTAFQSPARSRIAGKLDLELDELAATPAGDQPERRAALDGAMAKMAGGSGRLGWIDTAPMVNAGPEVLGSKPDQLEAQDTL